MMLVDNVEQIGKGWGSMLDSWESLLSNMRRGYK